MTTLTGHPENTEPDNPLHATFVELFKAISTKRELVLSPNNDWILAVRLTEIREVASRYGVDLRW